jgi:aminopeptidase N
MWFGNLVTMKWWDDLWLNESFADYICMVAASYALTHEFPEVWQSFLSRKGWGYSTDQLPTTHPISLVVGHTAQVDTLFDGISYSKGAAVLKQLSFVVGEENFRAGIRKYMAKYQYSNATFEDLITMLDAEVELGIHQWAASWVKTAGLNQVEAFVSTSAEGLVNLFEIVGQALMDGPSRNRDSIPLAPDC